MSENANELLMRGGIGAFQGGRVGEAEEMMRRVRWRGCRGIRRGGRIWGLFCGG